MLTKAQEAALKLLEKLDALRAPYDSLNGELKRLQGDFYSHQSPIVEPLYDPVVDLIDAVLGDDIGSYFLFECSNMKEGGKIIDHNKKEWPIRNIQDVRAYVESISEND